MNQTGFSNSEKQKQNIYQFLNQTWKYLQKPGNRPQNKKSIPKPTELNQSRLVVDTNWNNTSKSNFPNLT